MNYWQVTRRNPLTHPQFLMFLNAHMKRLSITILGGGYHDGKFIHETNCNINTFVVTEKLPATISN
jgi:hypothetical protein